MPERTLLHISSMYCNVSKDTYSLLGYGLLDSDGKPHIHSPTLFHLHCSMISSMLSADHTAK